MPTERRPEIQGGATRQSRRGLWFLFALLLTVYLLSAKGFSEVGDAETYFALAQNLVERGRVDLPPEAGLGSRIADSPTGVFTGPDGCLYVHFGLGYPLLEVPFYLLGRALVALLDSSSHAGLAQLAPRAAVSLCGPLLTAVTAVLVALLLLHLRLGLRPALAGGLLFGLGTMAWPYTKLGFYEPFLALCATTAVWTAVAYEKTGRWGWPLLCGFVLGWGLAAKVAFGQILPVLAIYILMAALRRNPATRIRQLALATLAGLAGLVPWLLLMGWYNALRTGSVLDFGYRAGLFGLDFSPQHFLSNLYAYTLGPGQGLFVYNPLLLLVLAAPLGLAPRGPRLLLGICALVGFILQVAWTQFDIWPWGPRYLLPFVPLLAVLATEGLIRCRHRPAGRAAATVLAAASVLVQLLAICAPYGRHLQRVVEGAGSTRAIVFDWRHFPLAGQAESLLNSALTPLSLAESGLAQGRTTEEFRRALRETPDFWWAYAWRLGAPWPWLLAGVLSLLGVALGSALGLRRVWQPSPKGGDDHGRSG